MRRTFIALAAAATIGVPALYSGGAQAQPATTGSMNGNGHTQALNATRGVLAPTSPMLEIHWAVNDDQKPPTPDGPNDPNPPTPGPSEPGAGTVHTESIDALSDREKEIVTLVGRAMSNAEIAQHLVLAESTIKSHLNRILHKLELRDRAQLIVLAYESGLVRVGG